MTHKTQFESDADVERHFGALAQLSRRPQPPDDLWDRLEQCRRVAQKRSRGAQHPVPVAPSTFRYTATKASRRHPPYRQSEIREVSVLRVNGRKRANRLPITPAPTTLASLARSASYKKKGR